MTVDSSQGTESRPNAEVTVIIPAYRAEGTIARALDSLAAQTVKPRAVVVVDDGSPDKTYGAALAQRHNMNGIALTVIRQDNAGAGAARNRALAEADTEYVAFLDADDEWLPAKLERSMAYMVDTERILVAHDSFEVRNGQETRIECARRFRAGGNAPFVALYRRGYIDTTTVVARRDAVIAVGGFDVTLPNAQDFELWLALLRKPHAQFEVFDETLTRYHITAGSIMSHIERRRRCCMKIARRYVFDLRHHPGSPLVSLWFRVLAIHWEAIAAHRAKSDRMGLLWTLVVLPGELVSATAGYLTGRRSDRSTGLAENDLGQPT